MNYITPSGSYYEGDKAHVNDVECAKRPEGYLFTGTVSLDPQVMWRPLTAQEISDAKDIQALELQRVKDALAACLEVTFAFVKNPALHSTANQFKQAAIQAYRAKL
jgi:hypothetical protein